MKEESTSEPTTRSLSTSRLGERHPTPDTEVAATTNKLEPIDIKQLRDSLKLLKDKEVYNSLKKYWPRWKLEFAELVAQLLEEVLGDDY